MDTFLTFRVCVLSLFLSVFLYVVHVSYPCFLLHPGLPPSSPLHSLLPCALFLCHLSPPPSLLLVLLLVVCAGCRPSGLEEDVRQYEQDLAKRLYQARVRASQGGSPGPEAPASSTSSADSQLRSAPRSLGRTHGIVGVCRGVLLA